MRRAQVTVHPPAARRRSLALIAALALTVGGAFLPGPANGVEVVDTSRPLMFTCVLHRADPDAPWVGARTAPVEGAAAAR